MSPDLSNLPLSQDPVEVDAETYVDPSEFPPPIPGGVYTFKQGKPAFEATKGGFLSANMTQTVDGGPQDGAKLAFDRVSDKPFDRQGSKASMAMDHLRAVYGSSVRASTHEEYATLLEQGEGKPFKAQVDWEGYCGHKGTPNEVTDSKQGYTVKGERNFPTDPNTGRRLEQVECPTCKQTVQARARIVRRIPA